MSIRWVCQVAVIGLIGCLSGVGYAQQQQQKCTATNLGYDPSLSNNGALVWYNNAWRYVGNTTLKFSCTASMAQSGCGVCSKTYLKDADGNIIGNPLYTPYMWYTCGTNVNLSFQIWGGPLTTGKDYSIWDEAWSLSPNGTCPPPAGTFPDASTGDVIVNVPPAP